jgi:hypothetical protein
LNTTSGRSWRRPGQEQFWIMTDTQPADLKTSLEQHLADKFDRDEDLVF